jgi:hypothetical protein
MEMRFQETSEVGFHGYLLVAFRAWCCPIFLCQIS